MGTAAVAWAAEMRGAAAMETVADAEEARAAAAAAAKAAAKAPVVTEMGGAGAAEKVPEVLVVHQSSQETWPVMQVLSEMMVAVMVAMAALLEMAEVIVVAARAGAAAWTAAMAGTAAGTEHEGDSRSSRCQASTLESRSPCSRCRGCSTTTRHRARHRRTYHPRQMR
jgi:hypothetical protein